MTENTTPTLAFERKVSHERAREALHAFVASHINSTKDRHARLSIPTQADDDDIVLGDYITQQSAAPAPEADVQALVDGLLSLLTACAVNGIPERGARAPAYIDLMEAQQLVARYRQPAQPAGENGGQG